ncbi:hypothetical protein, partial [uncultured Oribacterium sp.]|uniref:hypothetical protein n=1 Tax=uncultured Oribacterium sp. TaxID=462198 RepID=UPI002804DD8B
LHSLCFLRLTSSHREFFLSLDKLYSIFKTIGVERKKKRQGSSADSFLPVESHLKIEWIIMSIERSYHSLTMVTSFFARFCSNLFPANQRI